MTDVRWFTREEVLASLAGRTPDLRLPDPVAIAHHLIRAWAEGQVVFQEPSAPTGSIPAGRPMP